MNTIRTYTGESNAPQGFEISKQQMEFQVAVLIDVVQALLDRMAEKEGKKLGIMQVQGVNGPKFEIYENH